MKEQSVSGPAKAPIRIDAAASDVIAFEHQGSDLVLTLQDGRQVTVTGFFDEDAAVENVVLFSDGARFAESDWSESPTATVSTKGKYSETPMEPEVAAPIVAAVGTLSPWLLAAGALGAAGVVAALDNDKTPANIAPVAGDDTALTQAGQPVTIDVLANDSDPDGDAADLTVTGLGALAPAKGTVALVNGEVVYTPNPGESGEDQFSYIVTDADGGTAEATVTVTINAAPVATDDAATTAAGTAVTIDVLANDSDPDGDTLTLSAVGTAQNGTVEIVNGAAVYTPNAGFSGSTDSFDYTVVDGNGGTSTATVTVTVTAPDPAGDQGQLGILDPVIGNGGLLADITGDNGLLGAVTGPSGLLGQLLGSNGPLGGITGPGGLVDNLLGQPLIGDLDAQPAGSDGIIDFLVADEGLLGFLTGNSGLLGDVTGSDGLLGDLLNGALEGLTGMEGLVGQLTGQPLLGEAAGGTGGGGLLDGLLGGDGGLLGGLLGGDGGLLGGVLGGDGGFLGGVLGDDGLVGGLLGGDGGLLGGVLGDQGLVGGLLGGDGGLLGGVLGDQGLVGGLLGGEGGLLGGVLGDQGLVGGLLGGDGGLLGGDGGLLGGILGDQGLVGGLLGGEGGLLGGLLG